MECRICDSHGLLSLTGPAFILVLRHLIDCGSGKLTELLCVCKELRGRVFECTPQLTYLPQHACDAHKGLQKVVRRPSGKLELTVDLTGCDVAATETFFATGPWPAVNKLNLWGEGPSTTCNTAWGHMLGPSVHNLRVLELEDLSIHGDFLLSLSAACSHLTSLSFGPRVELDTAALKTLHAFPTAAPRCCKLIMWSWAVVPVLQVLAPQLTHLICPGSSSDMPKLLLSTAFHQTIMTGSASGSGSLSGAAEAAASSISATALHANACWLDVLLRLPKLTHLTLHGVQDLNSSSSCAAWPCLQVLQLADYVDIAALPLLPLQALPRLELVGLQMSVSSDAAGMLKEVTAAADALQHPMSVVWGDTQDDGTVGTADAADHASVVADPLASHMHYAMTAGHSGAAGNGELRVLMVEAGPSAPASACSDDAGISPVASAMAALAPLAPLVNLSPSLYICPPPAEPAPFGVQIEGWWSPNNLIRAMGQAELQALSSALASCSCLAHVQLCVHMVMPGFWLTLKCGHILPSLRVLDVEEVHVIEENELLSLCDGANERVRPLCITFKEEGVEVYEAVCRVQAAVSSAEGVGRVQLHIKIRDAHDEA